MRERERERVSEREREYNTHTHTHMGDIQEARRGQEDHFARREGDGNKEPRTDTPTRDTQTHGVEVLTSLGSQAGTLRETTQRVKVLVAPVCVLVHLLCIEPVS